jgi:F-type H+-transporting ATPase subunit delta
MRNPRLASRYAKSLLDLAVEQKVLDAVYADINMLKNVMKSSIEMVGLLRSPIIPADKKLNILNSVLDGKISTLTGLFIKLLINKRRESNLPEIVTAFIEQYNEMHHIYSVKITTAQPLTDEMQTAIVNKVKESAKIEKIELTTEVKEELIGGYVLEMSGKLIDASILRDLNDVKRQFESNEYIHNIR